MIAAIRRLPATGPGMSPFFAYMGARRAFIARMLTSEFAVLGRWPDFSAAWLALSS